MTPREAGQRGYHDGLMMGALHRTRRPMADVLDRRVRDLRKEPEVIQDLYAYGFQTGWNRPLRHAGDEPAVGQSGCA